MDRAEVAGLAEVEAVRIEANIYQPGAAEEEQVFVAPSVPSLPVLPQFLDLPILSGSEVPHAPHIAVSADPWPGSAAVFSSSSSDGFSLNTEIGTPAPIGVTLNGMDAAEPWIFDRGPALQVQFGDGALTTASVEDVLNGANVAVIGGQTSANWEVFQFTDADLIAPQTWALSGRLRGQAGSEKRIPQTWPPGSRVVIMDGSAKQINLPLSERGLDRTYRIGPSDRPYDDASYIETTEAFDGVGLQPYAPVHLRLSAMGGDVSASWVRRTRVDGDSWQSFEVPLGETSEIYDVRVRAAGTIVRTATTYATSWTYTSADQVADGVTEPFDIEVAQVSDAWGPGEYTRKTWNG